MTDENSQAVTEINFHGNQLVVVAGETPETTMVAMKPIVEGMGLAWEPQYRKINEHPVLRPTVTMMVMVAGDGKSRELTCLPLNRLSFWLATIQSNRIPDRAIREKVFAYQNECADVLHRHFGEVSAHSAGGEVSIGQIARAVVDLARTVIELQASNAELRGKFDLLRLTVDNPQQQVISDGGLTTVFDVIKSRAVKHRRRNGLTRSLGYLVERLCSERKISVERQIGSDTRLFPRALLNEFMNDKGWDLVEAYNNRIRGQGVLPFPTIPKRKPH